jgi:sporulation protein YlmC with PRC-barrel domain
MFKRHIAATSLALALMSATAIAQTTAPAPNTAPAAPSATAVPAPTATTVAPANMSWQGKWRSTQLIGVDIYGPNNEKVGDVTEVLFDKTGKIEMITVGVGGFLGLGQKDVAIPFAQVNWSEQPIASAAPAGGAMAPAGSTAPPASGIAAPTTGTAGKGTTGTAASARAPMMHPDHGKITLTKEQLTSAPAVDYSGT